MLTVCDFLKKCGYFFVATTDTAKPHLRPFGAVEIWNDQLIIQTGRSKAVAQQILANPNVEIVACDGENWMRITAVAKEVTDPAAEEKIYAGYPYMRGVYTAENPILVLALTKATAVWNPAEGESTTVHF